LNVSKKKETLSIPALKINIFLLETILVRYCFYNDHLNSVRYSQWALKHTYCLYG